MDYRVRVKEASMANIIRVKVIENEDICRMLCYPNGNIECCKRRMKILEEYGVYGLVNYGLKSVGNLKVVDIGYSSIIVLSITEGHGLVVLKILRADSRRTSLKHECNITSKASRIGVAPRIYECSDEILVLEYIDGVTISKLLELEADIDVKLVRKWLRAAIYKAYLLDINGIDHGELSRPYKHILISPRGVFIIDYESASTMRKPSNVTSMVSGLFLRNNKLVAHVRSILGLNELDLKEIIKALREYKHGGGMYNDLYNVFKKAKLLETL